MGLEDESRSDSISVTRPLGGDELIGGPSDTQESVSDEYWDSFSWGPVPNVNLLDKLDLNRCNLLNKIGWWFKSSSGVG